MRYLKPPATLADAVKRDVLHRHLMETDPEYREQWRQDQLRREQAADARRREATLDEMNEPAIGEEVYIPAGIPGVEDRFWYVPGIYVGRLRSNPNGSILGRVRFDRQRAQREATPEELKQRRRDLQARPHEEPRAVGRLEREPWTEEVVVLLRHLQKVERAERQEGQTDVFTDVSSPERADLQAGIDEAFFDALDGGDGEEGGEGPSC